MKVKLTRSGDLKETLNYSSGLKPEINYCVLEVKIRNPYEPNVLESLRCQLRIYQEDGYPGLYDMRQFELVSGKIPSNWIMVYDESDIYMGPRVWAKQGFWEAYFNDEPEAIKSFRASWHLSSKKLRAR